MCACVQFARFELFKYDRGIGKEVDADFIKIYNALHDGYIFSPVVRVVFQDDIVVHFKLIRK